MVVETKKNAGDPNFIEVKEMLADVKAEYNSLSKEDWSFLNNLLEARKDLRKKSDFTKIDVLWSLSGKMKKAGKLQKLRPFIDRIVANTPSTMLVPSGQNHKEVHGEIRFGEIHAAMDEEYISS